MEKRSDRSASRRLYYYTGKPWGMKALWEKRLKVAQYADVNDPFELIPFNLGKKKSREFWDRHVFKLLNGHHGLLCFSEDWRTTLMWSHYGEKHSGLCLGFDVKGAEPITYIDNPRNDPFDPSKSRRGVNEETLEAALRFKYSGWSYEREWRCRVRLSEATDGIFYKRFDDDLHLREVIIGARSPLTPADVVEAVSSPPLDVEIFKARSAYGTFEVCKHEHISTHTTKGFRATLRLAKDVYAHELPDELQPDREET